MKRFPFQQLPARRKIRDRHTWVKAQFERMNRELTVKDKGGNNVLVDEKRKAILDMDIEQLLEALKQGRVSPLEALKAYQVMPYSM